MATSKMADQIVLLALRGSEWGKTQTAIMYMTSLSPAVIAGSLRRLIGLRAVETQEIHETTHFFATQLSGSPIVPDVRRWLCDYIAYSRRVECDDEREEVFRACGEVLVAAIASGSREADLLGHLVQLPPDFAFLVLGLMDRTEIWSTDNALSLENMIVAEGSDLAAVSIAVNDLAEQFWNICWGSEIEQHLATLLFEQVTIDPAVADSTVDPADGFSRKHWIM